MTALRASDSFLSVWSTALRPRLFNAGPSSLLDRRGNVEGVDVSRKSQITIVFLLVINIACAMSRVAAQSDPYPKMAPVDQYLMERNAEIQLARSAAPDSISRDATILVLGRRGY